MLSVKELAKELGVSPKTIYALVDSQKIPHYRIGTGRGTLRFDLREVKEAIKARSKSVLKSVPKPSGKHLL